VLKNFSPKLADRLSFERKNLIEDECMSFRQTMEIADFCFEVSSEGELEQVLPLIHYLLNHNKKIELIFASPSVERKCQQLAFEFKKQIRILRLPIVSFFPVNILYFQSTWQWASAKTVFLCRYDFYPELLLLGLTKRLILLSAASKKKSWFKSGAFNCFDFIVAANNFEGDYFLKKHPEINSDNFDFRIPQIFDRLDKRSEKLKKHTDLSPYLKFLENHSRNNMLILGSAWRSDLRIFNETDLWKNKIINEKFHILFVPHSLKDCDLSSLEEELKFLFGEENVVTFSDKTDFLKIDFERLPPAVVILNWRGILCELYSYFDYSYVGGGLERSIHSVLEPFLAGNKVVVTGEISRSAEYDYVNSQAPNEICLLKNAQSFYNLFNEIILTSPDKSMREKVKIEANIKMNNILNEILNVK
jgi:3-deoxy-D-manno-octulosonic-acid transferase